jgi:hypothetical protein
MIRRWILEEKSASFLILSSHGNYQVMAFEVSQACFANAVIPGDAGKTMGSLLESKALALVAFFLSFRQN